MNAARRMISAMIVLVAAATVVRADDSADRAKANQAELEKLQGRWKIVLLTIRGQQEDGIARLGIVFDFKDDKLTVTSDSAGFAPQTRLLRLDANTTPKLLDFAETATAFAEHKEVVECVYSLDGDTLSFCVNLEGDQPAKANRPAAVESKADSAAALIKLERVK